MQLIDSDILVIGGGAAGIAAAYTASKQGLKTTLIEELDFLGGCATAAQVGTICGAHLRSSKNRIIPISSELVTKFVNDVAIASNTYPISYKEGLIFLPYQPSSFESVAARFLRDARVKYLLGAKALSVNVEDRLIKSIEIRCKGQDLLLSAKTFIDCSGTTTVASLNSDSSILDHPQQASAYVIEISGLPDTNEEVLRLTFIKSIVAGIRCGDLSQDATRISLIPGTLSAGKALIKIGLGLEDISTQECRDSLLKAARSFGKTFVSITKDSDPFFKDIYISNSAKQLGIRVLSSYRGEEILTEEQVASCAKSDSSSAIGCWPIEIWGEAREPIIRYFDEEDFYNIPSGCLKPLGYDNLLCAGRNISATSEALASARVIGTCLSTGEIAGSIAASLI